MQITLDGKHTFASSESLLSGEGTGGFGMCNEFGMNEPIGYDCLPGEAFPKLGIGLLTRPDERGYDFFRDYPLQPFPVEIESHHTDSVSFQVEPVACRGYAARLFKSVHLEKNKVSIHYELGNTGSKTIETDEYNHNFVLIDGLLLGSEYCLELPLELTSIPSLPPIFRQEGNRIRWLREPEDTFYFRVDCGSKVSNRSWILTHVPSGVAMSETLRAPLFRFALWGQRHVVSPEMFVRIRVQPGETITWSREYTFRSNQNP
jgi:hypothetical protein